MSVLQKPELQGCLCFLTFKMIWFVRMNYEGWRACSEEQNNALGLAIVLVSEIIISISLVDLNYCALIARGVIPRSGCR